MIKELLLAGGLSSAFVAGVMATRVGRKRTSGSTPGPDARMLLGRIYAVSLDQFSGLLGGILLRPIINKSNIPGQV